MFFRQGSIKTFCCVASGIHICQTCIYSVTAFSRMAMQVHMHRIANVRWFASKHTHTRAHRPHKLIVKLIVVLRSENIFTWNLFEWKQQCKQEVRAIIMPIYGYKHIGNLFHTTLYITLSITERFPKQANFIDIHWTICCIHHNS